VGGWESLRVDLQRLIAESPGAFLFGPNPDSERRYEKRIRIGLAAWATDIAAELHATYGNFVDLQVGAMRFPARELLVNPHTLQLHGEPAEDAGFGVEPLAPLTVRSGRHAHRDLLITNRTERTEVLITNGELSSAVTNSSRAVVGRFAGPHTLARVGFEIAPQQTRPVPVLIGTASVVPELGYAVPPGQWTLVVVLHTETGSMLLAPVDLTVSE
jgi:hypothetical protein